MKDSKGPTTQAMMFLKANGVAFTDHLYAYKEHGGTSVSARELDVDEHAVVKTELLGTGQIEQPADFSINDEAATRILVQIHFMLQSFQIDEPFEIRVKANTENGELTSSALRICIG